MTQADREMWAGRLSDAIDRCGGALMLLALPDEIKDVLRKTTDVKAKALMLEKIADKIEEVPFQ